MGWLLGGRRTPADFLSTVLGDIAFNLRSALDHMVCALARRADPDCTCTGTQFPIVTTLEKWHLSGLKGVPGKAVALIKSVQPYQRGDESAAALDPLNILNELCRAARPVCRARMRRAPWRLPFVMMSLQERGFGGSFVREGTPSPPAGGRDRRRATDYSVRRPWPGCRRSARCLAPALPGAAQSLQRAAVSPSEAAAVGQ
jgi:hypothetical protein